MDNMGVVNTNFAMEYRGYTGDLHYSVIDGCMYGRIKNKNGKIINNYILYEGYTLKEVFGDFVDAVIEYEDFNKNK